MIIGLFLKGYKAFNSTSYIPISDAAKFSTYIGDNGVGKSSILESLDTFFNDERFNRNKKQAQRGNTRLEDMPFISPVFLIHENDTKSLPPSELRLLKAISKYLKSLPDSHPALKDLKKHIQNPKPIENMDLVIFSKFFDEKKYSGCLFTKIIHKEMHLNKEIYGLSEDDFAAEITIGDKETETIHPFKYLDKLQDCITDQYTYVYIPVESNEEDDTKLQSRTVEKLAGNNLTNTIASIIKAPAVTKDINNQLESYIKKIEAKLDNKLHYSSGYSRTFTPALLIEKIIEGYFSTRVLHQGKEKIPIKDLSAGEKRQALLSFSIALLEKSSEENKGVRRVIFALDEPESSLHISRIYDQFEKLKRLSEACAQVIITTHWYGFLPILQKGWAHSLSKTDAAIEIESIDLANYLHETRNIKTESKGKRPLDTNIKGYNELVQSIINSVIKRENPYTWIICEGITDALYLRTFLENANIENLHIIPVAGAANVIKLYKLLHPIISDYKSQINSAIICLIDTDNQLPNLDELQDDILGKLVFRRLCNNAEKNYQTELLSYKHNITGITTIEDVLPALSFIETLKKYQPQLGFNPQPVDNVTKDYNSYQCLDLKTSERTKLKDFYNFNDGENKLLFANSFCEEYKKNPLSIEWIENLKKLISK